MLTARIFIIITLLFLQSCAFIKSEPHPYAYISFGVKLNLVSTEVAGGEKTLNQLLDGKYKDKKYSINLLTKISQQNIAMVALTKFGSRIFTISYDNKDIDFIATPLVPNPSVIRPEYILADIELIYWPVEQIRNNITGNIKITEFKDGNGLKRLFSKGGKPVIEISYDKKDKWRSKIRYKHLERSYEYTIKNL